ncbi:MAG: phosphodiester glycosidase family protein, partial [Gemmatimonadota bacterium]
VQQPALQPDSSRVENVAPGVRYEFDWYAAGPWAVHTLTVDPRACGIAFRTIKAGGGVVGRATTKSMVAHARDSLGLDVLAAINADFFSFEPAGVSEGPQIMNRTLLKSEGSHREAIEDRRLRLQPVFAFTTNGKPLLAHTHVRGSVRAGPRTVPLAGVNVRARADSAFVFTAFWGDTTAADSGALKLTVRNSMIARVDTAAGSVAIPRDGFVVVARGAARTVLAATTVGARAEWKASFAGLPHNVAELVGGYPMLLLNGRAVHHAEPGLRGAFSDRRHPRAAIGWGEDQRIRIVAVDGRRTGYSDGMTLQELGDYLLARGVTEALNFDGGGSATLVIGDRIVNRPTDASGERAVANALVVHRTRFRISDFRPIHECPAP